MPIQSYVFGFAMIFALAMLVGVIGALLWHWAREAKPMRLAGAGAAVAATAALIMSNTASA
ncbi:hypothetical protein [Chitinibacter sp. ZOR0017]|uniref:hypothetical protein n=1 Tax=Chitinibacter sp. ZOR0017 TaxID=1339254 RepID=UPI0006469C4D|nr:hypothetical protein [Chitinibacter sp. ZOR0017]